MYTYIYPLWLLVMKFHEPDCLCNKTYHSSRDSEVHVQNASLLCSTKILFPWLTESLHVEKKANLGLLIFFYQIISPNQALTSSLRPYLQI